MAPELIVGYTMDQTPGFVAVLSKAQIPTLLFQDWQEQNPLGRTEWIKVMGVLLDKEVEANTYFNQVVENYERVKKMAQRTKTHPTVISGAVYQGVWYVPGGKSWMATLFSDAQADYLFKDNDQTGSLALSVETVIEKAHQAAFWIAPAQHTSWREMKSDQPAYTFINAFSQKNVITYALSKGPTGGVLYFEQAALRPDWVLSDLVYFLHPEIMKGYTPHFFNYTTP
ncbi:MAG: ABC transporter substrate-binding protein [Flavobacteriaceae bacterium]